MRRPQCFAKEIKELPSKLELTALILQEINIEQGLEWPKLQQELDAMYKHSGLEMLETFEKMQQRVVNQAADYA